MYKAELKLLQDQRERLGTDVGMEQVIQIGLVVADNSFYRTLMEYVLAKKIVMEPVAAHSVLIQEVHKVTEQLESCKEYIEKEIQQETSILQQ